jgi:hypothetical protein
MYLQHTIPAKFLPTEELSNSGLAFQKAFIMKMLDSLQRCLPPQGKMCVFLIEEWQSTS